MVYDDNSDEEDNLSYRSDEDELLNDNRSSELEEEEEEEEEALGNDSDYLEELPPEEDDASYCTESSFRSHSTLGSTPGEEPCTRTHSCRVLLLCSRIVQNGAAAQNRAFVYRRSARLVLQLRTALRAALVFALHHFVPSCLARCPHHYFHHFCLCRFNSY